MSLIDCAAASIANGGAGNFSEADCDALPGFADYMLNEDENYQWEVVNTTTDDGYGLSMVRITGDENGDACPGDKGPVLILHGFPRDATSMLFNGSFTYPNRLCDEGYDVYLANFRGTPGSRTVTAAGVDPDDTTPSVQQEWWNFDDVTIGKQDVPAFVNQILTTRQAEGSDCLKVQILAQANGTVPALVAAATYPEAMSQAVGAIQLRDACVVSEINVVLAQLGLDSRMRRAMSSSSAVECDRNQYWDALRVLLGELSDSEFLKLFKTIVRHASYIEDEFGEDWQCDGNYVAALQSLVCEDYPCSSICRSENEAKITDLFKRFDELDIYSFNGP